MSIDTRARAAAEAVHESVDRITVQPPDYGRRRQRQVVAAALTIVTLLVASVAILATRDGNDSTRVAAEGGGLHPLVPASPPDGFLIDGAFDLPQPTSQIGVQRLYGKAAGRDPFGDGDLSVTVIGSTQPDDDDGEDASPLDPTREDTVALADGTVALYNEGGGRFARSLRWFLPGHGEAMVSSYSLDRGQLISVADSLDVGPDGAFEVTALPDGYTLVAELPDMTVVSGLGVTPARADAEGHVLVYRPADGSRAASVSILVVEAGAAEMSAFRWMAGPSVEATQIRGRPALRSVIGAGDHPLVHLGWFEAEGVLVEVSTIGLPEDEAVEIAESLEPVDDDTWQTMRPEFFDPADDAEVVAEGVTETGRWRLTLGREGSLCIHLRDDLSTGGGCGIDLNTPIEEFGEPYLIDPTFLNGVAYGRADRSIQQVVLVLEDGSRLEAPIYGRDLDTLLMAWAVAFPAGNAPQTAIGLDGDGNEITRRDL